MKSCSTITLKNIPTKPKKAIIAEIVLIKRIAKKTPRINIDSKTGSIASVRIPTPIKKDI